eukprot:scaffold1318_cov362-Pavlova_lutheri.AAC.35
MWKGVDVGNERYENYDISLGSHGSSFAIVTPHDEGVGGKTHHKIIHDPRKCCVPPSLESFNDFASFIASTSEEVVTNTTTFNLGSYSPTAGEPIEPREMETLALA